MSDENLTPSNSPMPSNASNNPMFAPFLDPFQGVLTLGDIPEGTAIGDDLMGYMATPLGPRNVLMECRAKFPYLPIVPMTRHVATYHLAANQPATINVSSGASFGVFRGSGDYFVSSGGDVRIPDVGGRGDDAIYRPDNRSYYLNGIKQLSLISPVDCFVSFEVYYISELPR